MIRDAKFEDVPTLAAMLREMHAASKYLGRVQICEKVMDALLMGLIAGQRQPGPQGSHLVIAEQAGKAVGFLAGSLDRVYHIGDKLWSNDIYLFARPGARVAATFGLIDSYIAWASGNRRVIDIRLSWSDALPGADRIAAVYARKGFIRTGEMFEMAHPEPRRLAA